MRETVDAVLNVEKQVLVECVLSEFGERLELVFLIGRQLGKSEPIFGGVRLVASECGWQLGELDEWKSLRNISIRKIYSKETQIHKYVLDGFVKVGSEKNSHPSLNQPNLLGPKLFAKQTKLVADRYLIAKKYCNQQQWFELDARTNGETR